VRRSVIIGVGGFDERFFMYCEDRLLGSRLSQAGWISMLVPAAIALHEGGSSSGIDETVRGHLWAQSFRLAMTLTPAGGTQLVFIIMGLIRRILRRGPLAPNYRNMLRSLFPRGKRRAPSGSVMQDPSGLSSPHLPAADAPQPCPHGGGSQTTK
jgi:GT2 family glycosyltransferase